jgi:signal transduction histidine kinase/ActR/RegA family two-component response regulator
VLVNQAFRELFGSEPPPEYNILKDEIAEANGVLGLIHRAFAGETISTPPIWYDPRKLTQVKITEGRGCAMTSTFFPLRSHDGSVQYIAIVFEDITDEWLGRERAEAALGAAESVERRARFLAETSKLLSESLDYQQTLERVVRSAVPEIADFCLVDIIDDNEQVKRVAATHVNPGHEAILKQLERLYPAVPGSAQAAARVMREGRSILHEEVTPELLTDYAVDEKHWALMQRLEIRSYLVVPLNVRGRTLGSMSLGMSESQRRYRAADVAFAEELADRAAAAIDNSRLFARAEEARHEADAARQAAEGANRAKDEFLAMLGHELRNPLAPITTALSLIQLRREASSEVPSREWEIIDRQVQYLARLVDDLLDVSRIRSGKIELRRAHVELADLVSSAVEMVSPLLEQRRHRLNVQVPRGLVLDADEARLAQVLANLLSNAARYTDDGGQIAISAREEAGQVLVGVVDNGRGIEPDMLPRIFDLFVQGDRTPERREGCLGLGLALVRSLTQLHGGTVEARSGGPGHGSELIVRLPLANRQEPTPNPDAQSQAEERPVRRQSILVVDDNLDAAELLARVFEREGHLVVTAYDGVEALAKARELRPDVAVLDIGLPVMDGYELARRLRQEISPTLRLIAVTGYGQERDRRRSKELGFSHHFVKPVDIGALLVAVNEAPSEKILRTSSPSL